MADEGMLVCTYREIGCLFTCVGEAAMARHVEAGNSNHLMSVLLLVKQMKQEMKQMTEEHRDVVYWKRQQEQKEKEMKVTSQMQDLQLQEKDAKILHLTSELQALRRSHSALEAKVVEHDLKLANQSQHVANLEKNGAEQMGRLDEATNKLASDYKEVQNKLRQLEVNQGLHDDRIAHCKSSVVDLENARRADASGNVIRRFEDLKKELTNEQKGIHDNISKLEADVKKAMEKVADVEKSGKVVTDGDSARHFEGLKKELKDGQRDLEGKCATLDAGVRKAMEKLDGLATQVERENREILRRQEEAAKRLQQQLSVVQDLTLNSGVFLWRITRVLELLKINKELDDDILSPVFFTHKRGYKMQVEMHTNEKARGEGPQLSVFVKICKGQNDDEQRWPFTKNITIELLDLTGDMQHVSETTYAGAFGPKHWQEPIFGDNPGVGHDMIAHSELRRKGCRFLKNDSLYIRITLSK